MKNLLITAALILASLTAGAQDQKAKCQAITQAKTQCTRSAQEGKTTCKQHDSSQPKCGAVTQAGGTCKRHVQKAGQKCKSHSTQPTTAKI